MKTKSSHHIFYLHTLNQFQMLHHTKLLFSTHHINNPKSCLSPLQNPLDRLPYLYNLSILIENFHLIHNGIHQIHNSSHSSLQQQMLLNHITQLNHLYNSSFILVLCDISQIQLLLLHLLHLLIIRLFPNLLLILLLLTHHLQKNNKKPPKLGRKNANHYLTK